MGSAVAIVSAIASAASTAYSVKSSRDAKKDAEKAAKLQADKERRQTAEEKRRLAAENARRESMARARAASSGASGTSADAYMEALKKSGRKEIDWLSQVGATRYNQAVQRGKSEQNRINSSMWSNVISGVGETASHSIDAYTALT